MSRRTLTTAIALGLALALFLAFGPGEGGDELEPIGAVFAGEREVPPGGAQPAEDRARRRSTKPAADSVPQARPPRSSGSGDQEASATEHEATGPRRAERRTLRASGGAARSGGPPPAQLDVIVRDASGQPAPGLVVRAYVEDPDGGRARAARTTSSDHGSLQLAPTTNSEGRCWIDAPARLALRLVVRDAEGVTRTGSLRVQPLAVSEVRAVELGLRAGRTVMQRFTVVDAGTGAEMSGARAWVLPRGGAVDGGWELAAPDATSGGGTTLVVPRSTQREVVMVVGAPGRGPAALARVGLGSRDEVPLRLPLRAGAVLEVVALDGVGRPVRGATLRVSMRLVDLAVDERRPLPDQRLTRVARTNAEGLARLEDLPPGVSLDLQAEGLGGLPEGLVLEAGETRRLPATAGDGAQLAGRVLDEAGQPAGGLELWLLPATAPGPRLFGSEDAAAATRLVTDDQGRFSQAALPAGSWWLGPAPGSESVAWGSRLEVSLPSPDLRVDLVAHAPRWLSGRVLDADGLPVEGALVSGLGPRGLEAESTSGADGAWKLGPLPPGPWAVASRPGAADHGSRTLQVAPAPAPRPITLVQRPGAGVRATAVRAGRVVERFTQVILTDLEGRVRAQVGEAASLDQEGLRDGSYSICAVFEDGRVGLAEAVHARAGQGPTDAVLRMVPTGRLSFPATSSPIPYRVWLDGTCVGVGRTRAAEPTGIEVPAGEVIVELHLERGPFEARVELARDQSLTVEVDA